MLIYGPQRMIEAEVASCKAMGHYYSIFHKFKYDLDFDNETSIKLLLKKIQLK